MWVVGADGSLYHTFWDGSYYHGFENLGGSFSTAPQVAHWSVGRIDIVGQFAGEDSQYQYKYYDGSQWSAWLPKGGNFASQPAVTSWSEGNLNILGVDTEGTLKWQMWIGGQWWPSADGYYSLGNTSDPYAKGSGVPLEQVQKPAGQTVMNGYKAAL